MCKLINIDTNYGVQIQVADIKSICIKNIIRLAPMCNYISEIILFGSALEECCTEQSDIDIASVSNKTVSALSKNRSFSNMFNTIYTLDWSQEYDGLYFRSLNEIVDKQYETPICKELIQKGRIIYRIQERLST